MLSTSRSTAARTALRSSVALCESCFSTSLAEYIESDHVDRVVNGHQRGNKIDLPTLPTKSNACGTPSRKHWDEEWSKADIDEAFHENVGFTWGAGNAYKNLPLITRGEGIYLIDDKGKKYIDWTSQAVCANLGHTVPDSIQASITKQIQDIAMVYSGLGNCPVRSRLSKLLAELLPGDINGFIFPSGGNEANEAAIRIARRYTGKSKIMTRHRSYHGGSGNTLSATGDFRRWFVNEVEAPGIVKMFDPNPWNFDWGPDEDTACAQSLAAMEDQILAEGPASIAAVFIETVPGAAGVLIPPKGYVEGVRALCDKYDILMICDEVMTGFGRTGQMFGFQNFEGVLPDIVTFAKGISGSFLPLSGVGFRQPIKDFFAEKPMGWGATYNAHPVAMACGYETIKYMLDHDVVGHTKRMEVVMKEEMQNIMDKHDSVKQSRAIGLFGCMDLVGKDGHFIQQLQDKPGDAVMAFKAKFRELGMYGLMRPPLLHVAPPLIITEHELRDGFNRVDQALDAFDAAR